MHIYKALYMSLLYFKYRPFVIKWGHYVTNIVIKWGHYITKYVIKWGHYVTNVILKGRYMNLNGLQNSS